MLLKCSTLKTLVKNEAIEHIEAGGTNWCLPSPTRSRSTSSCRLVGHAPDGRVLVVLETLSGSSSVFSEIYLQSSSSPIGDAAQNSSPIFKISAAAIVYHCALSPGAGAFLLVTFVSIASPFSSQPVKRARRLHDTILVSLSLQNYQNEGSWPSFEAGCDTEAVMRAHGMKILASGTPDPVIGYFLSDEQRPGRDTTSSASSPHHSSVLQIDGISITMEKLSVLYFLVSYALGAVLDEYILPFTSCVYYSPQGTNPSQKAIEQINIRFNQAFTNCVKSFIIWHEARHLGTLLSYMREPVSFRHFLPSTGDLVVVTRQRVSSQASPAGAANLTVSIYKASCRSLNQLSSLSAAQPSSLSSPQILAPSVQILKHITSLCIGTFPDYPLTVAEAFSALIPGTIGVSFGHVSSTLPIVAFEYFLPSPETTDPAVSSVPSMAAMLTLVSPFTEAVYNTSVRIDTDMEGLKMTGRDDDKIEVGVQKHADATNFRLFSTAISSYILYGLAPSELNSASLLDSLVFKVAVRNSYRHSFFSICSTQLFFTSNLIIWIIPDPVANAAKMTLVSCSQIGGFSTVFMGADTLLSLDITTLFNSGVVRRIPAPVCASDSEISDYTDPYYTEPLQSSLFDVLCATQNPENSLRPVISRAPSDTLIYQPRRMLRHTTQCSVSKSAFKTKSKYLSHDAGNTGGEHDIQSIEKISSFNDPDLTTGSVSSQFTGLDTRSSETCIITGLFSEVTHLIPVTAEKVSYVTILKELDLHRSGTLLDCSSRRFVQLPTTFQGTYSCDCAFLARRPHEQRPSGEESWRNECTEVRKRFQTIYLYDTYLCRLVAVEINYQALLSHLLSERQRSYLHNELQKMKLLIYADNTYETTENSPEKAFINSLGLKLDQFFLNSLLSVQIFSFFYFLSILVFECATCPVHPYLVSNVMSNILGTAFSVSTNLCEEEHSCDTTRLQLIDQFIKILFSSQSLSNFSEVSDALKGEAPLALFSVLYQCSAHTVVLNDYDWLSKELAGSAFAACYYRKLMRKNILIMRSIRQVYKSIQPISSLLDMQLSYLQSFAQMDEMGMQVTDVVLKNSPHFFNPRVLVVNRPDSTACLHPLSKHITHMSSVYSCLRDYYIYHRSPTRDLPRQIKPLRCHHLPRFTGSMDDYTIELDTAAFTRQVNDCLAKIQACMYQVTSQAFTAAPTLWVPLLEIYEEFMGNTYSSMKIRYPGMPDNLWRCASDYLEKLDCIPYKSAWIKEPDTIPQYLYPCYKYTSNYLEPISRQTIGSSRGQSFKKPLSNVLSLLLEYSALRLAIMQEERSSYPTFLRLLDTNHVKLSESHSDSRSRSRSRLGRHQGHHSDDLTIDTLSACSKKLLEASRRRLSYIESQFDLPLPDISAQVSMDLLEFEITYGPVVPESSRFSIVASTFQRSDSFTSVASVSSRPTSRASSRSFRREAQTRTPSLTRPIDSMRGIDQPRCSNSNNYSDLQASTDQSTADGTSTSFAIKQVHECDGLDRNSLSSFLKYLWPAP